MKRWSSLFAAIVVVASSASAAQAGDWTSYRGGAEGNPRDDASAGFNFSTAWTLSQSSSYHPDCVVAAGGRAFTMVGAPGDPSVSTLIAVDSTTGVKLWESATFATPKVTCPATDGTRAYAASADGFMAFAADTGAPLWTQSLTPGQVAGAPLVSDGRIFAQISGATCSFAGGTASTCLREFATDSGARVADVEVVDAASGWQDRATVVGGVAVGFDRTDGSLVARQVADGSLVWKDQISKPQHVISDGVIYYLRPASDGTQGMSMVARKVQSGAVSWVSRGRGAPVGVMEGIVFVDTNMILIGAKTSDGSWILEPPPLNYDRYFAYGKQMWALGRVLYPAEKNDWVGLRFKDDGNYDKLKTQGALPAPRQGAAFHRGTFVSWSDAAPFALSGKRDFAPPTKPVIDTSDLVIDNYSDTLRWTHDAEAWPQFRDYGVMGTGSPYFTVDRSVCNPVCTIPFAALSDGPATVVIRAWDQAGNWIDSDPVTFTVKLQQPDDVFLPPPPGETGVSINGGAAATNDPNVTLNVVWSESAREIKVSNDGGFGAAGGTKSFGLSPTIPWKLQSTGAERLPKTIYVRFPRSSTGSTTFTDDIVLDQTLPAVSGASVAARIGGRIAAGMFRVRVRGADASSGISKVLFSPKRAMRPAKTVVLRRSTSLGLRKLDKIFRVRMTRKPIFVQVVDAAGNRSAWRRIR